MTTRSLRSRCGVGGVSAQRRGTIRPGVTVCLTRTLALRRPRLTRAALAGPGAPAGPSLQPLSLSPAVSDPDRCQWPSVDLRAASCSGNYPWRTDGREGREGGHPVGPRRHLELDPGARGSVRLVTAGLATRRGTTSRLRSHPTWFCGPSERRLPCGWHRARSEMRLPMGGIRRGPSCRGPTPRSARSPQLMP